MFAANLRNAENIFSHAVAKALARSYHWTIAPCGIVTGTDVFDRSYCNSLREMEKTLELLLENTALFTGRVEDTL